MFIMNKFLEAQHSAPISNKKPQDRTWPFFHCLDCDLHIGLHIGLPYIQVYTDPYSFFLVHVVEAVGHLCGFLVTVRIRIG